MSQVATALATIQTLAAGVLGAGVCQLGQRQWSTPEVQDYATQDAAATVPQAHVWYLYRDGSPETPWTCTGLHLRAHVLTLDGYYQVRDPSVDPAATVVGTSLPTEATFSEEVETLCSALRASSTLQALSVSEICPEAGPLEIRPIPQPAGSTPIQCHYSQIRVVVTERIVVTP